MTYRGHVRNGVVVLDNGSSLADGTVVKVEPLDAGALAAGELPPLFHIGERAKKTGIPDLARNHDHYLYGHPKAD